MRSIRSFANDDRHVMVKHSTIYPSPEELEAVQNMVSTVECALKHVSDWLDEKNKSAKCEGDVEAKEEAAESNAKDQSGRTLCGVMRIGLVAKGLLIKDDMDLELVLMCKEKPTKTLLCIVKDNLPVQIQKLTEEKYLVEEHVNEAAIIIRNTKEPKLTLKVILTSPLIRDEAEKKEGEHEETCHSTEDVERESAASRSPSSLPVLFIFLFNRILHQKLADCNICKRCSQH